MIQYLTFVLVLMLVIDRFVKVDSKRIIEFFKPRKRLKAWLWSKSPRASNEQWLEWRKEAFNTLSEKDRELLNLDDHLWLNESNWTEEQVQKKKDADIVFSKLKVEELRLRNVWIKTQNPVLYYLIKLKLM